MKRITLTLATAVFAFPAFADDDSAAARFGLAGILSATNSEDLPPIMLSAGQPLADAPLFLKSGTYYEIEIEADGSQELALVGAGFFRAIWIDEIVVEGLEIRPLGIDSFEFDEAGVMEVGFVAIKPGSYTLSVPQSRGDLQTLQITIE